MFAIPTSQLCTLVSSAKKLLGKVHENDNDKECERNISADVSERNSDQLTKGPGFHFITAKGITKKI